MTPLTRRDLLLIAASILIAALSVAVIVRYFATAFPEASIDFRYDRNTSRPIAEKFAASHLDLGGMKHAARFDADNNARIFLERTLGLERASVVMRDDVRVWYWHHRWFRPLQEEEISVDVAPTGEIVSFSHQMPEDRAIGGAPAGPPVEFLRGIGVRVEDLRLVSTSERRLPKRMQRIYTWESASIKPGGAPYRHTVIVDGNRVTSYSQRIKVPDAWLRSYRDLRSKNIAAGLIDRIFLVATMIAALVLFVIRLRRGDLHLRFLLVVAVVSILLVGGMVLNSMPSQLADYDTKSSYSAFLGQLALSAVIQSLGTAMLLVVICGAGEVLYRQRLPKQLAIPRLWNRRALGSKRVFLALVIGYALVPLFIAYQVVFYLVARKFGAWSPADVPYDEMLNSALPWVPVLFAGFFPAFSEEFLSRGFSIPFFQRFLRSRIAAIVAAGFIWGFGHAMYPNQPFYIRGLEVGLVGVAAGLLMDRFGLLPLLIWHYTIDAVYTATLLFASGNAYYIASAAAASLLFAIPLIGSVAFYVRHKGFAPDEELSNETLPVAPPPEHPEVAVAAAEFPARIGVTRKRVVLCASSIIVAAVALTLRPPSPEDAIDYRITPARAKEIARAHLPNVRSAYVIAAPVEGFRVWDRDSPREDGGAPGGFDEVAATYVAQQKGIAYLTRVFRERLEAGTWTVRFFTPLKKEEIFVEIDPRTSRVIGYHKYQDEENPGASLTRAAALDLARRAFPRYGIDVRAFDVKEALTFQQPKRRDWLFHFDERTPIAALAYRRVTVRVAGAEVTQFNKTVKLPESIYREANKQTLLNVVLFAAKIIGLVALLALAVAGIVMASRTRGLPWRRALRWTLILSIIPIASLAARYELTLFGYSTSTAWETFRVRLITEFVTDAGKQIGLLFIALAGLEAAVPYALSLATREGRARLGRAAAVAAVTAVAVLAAIDGGMQWIDYAWRSAAAVTLSVSEGVATPLPALFDGAQAVFGAMAASGAIALFAHAAGRHIAVITIVSVFAATLDPLATPAQAPLMLLRSLIVAISAWLVARYVLNKNPLAWPLAIFLAVTLQIASVLLHNHRPDLIANGVALIAFAFVALLWAIKPRTVADV